MAAPQTAASKPAAAPAVHAVPAAEKAAPAAKKETVITTVKMTDGRTVDFAGKRKMMKETVISGDKVSVRFDFVNGETRLFHVPHALLHQFAAHGASQKIGDEAAGVEDIDDIVVAIDDITARLTKGEWSAVRAAGDGFSGASVVIRAIAEVTGKSAEQVKAFLQGKLDAAKAKGENLSRAELYASFKAPNTKTGIVIARMEKEKAVKSVKFNADDLLGEIK